LSIDARSRRADRNSSDNNSGLEETKAVVNKNSIILETIIGEEWIPSGACGTFTSLNHPSPWKTATATAAATARIAAALALEE